MTLVVRSLSRKVWNGPATLSKSVRLTYSGAGAGAGVGLSEGGEAVFWANAVEDSITNMVLAMKTNLDAIFIDTDFS